MVGLLERGREGGVDGDHGVASPGEPPLDSPDDGAVELRRVGLLERVELVRVVDEPRPPPPRKERARRQGVEVVRVDDVAAGHHRGGPHVAHREPGMAPEPVDAANLARKGGAARDAGRAGCAEALLEAHSGDPDDLDSTDPGPVRDTETLNGEAAPCRLLGGAARTGILRQLCRSHDQDPPRARP